MKKYLLPENGNFYKANLHCHSTVSDGTMTPEEIKEHYKKNGYAIVAYTDHEILVPHNELADEDFLPLNGYEMQILQEGPEDIRTRKCCHICLIATAPDNVKQICHHCSKYVWGNALKYLNVIQFDENEPDYERVYSHEGISDIMKKGLNNGFFVTYNHPSWSQENYSDYMGYNYMNAMEIYNYGCVKSGYPDYNEKEYDDMLRGDKRIFCIAADDNHRLENCCGGFTMIKADKLEYKTITDALVNGNFYSSHGPLIHNLWFEDGKIHVDCSDAVKIRLNTGIRRSAMLTAGDGEVINSADFDVVPVDGYVRITVIDSQGNCANTNAYFTDSLF